MRPGKTQIVATAEGGNATDTCNVTVYTKIEEITLNKTNITLNKAHPTFQLKATVKPAEAVDTPVIWSSDNEEAATVDETGLVTAQNKGEAIITVATTDGKLHADCLVIVSENVGIDSNALHTTCIFTTDDAIQIQSGMTIQSVQLIDMAGRTILHQAVDNTDVTIDAAGLAKGAASYLINISYQNGQSNTHKLIL